MTEPRRARALRRALGIAAIMGTTLHGSARAQERPPPPASAGQAAPPAPVPAPSVPPAPPAAAPAWRPIVTASYLTRYELRSGYDDLGVSRGRFLEGDAVFYRMRVGVGTGLLDLGGPLKVGIQLTPQATGFFGNLATTTVDASAGIHEGYLRVSGRFVRMDAGRFELNYGDSLLIGQLDWNENGRSFDGVRARIAGSPTSAWVDLFLTAVREGRADQVFGIADGDEYFGGIYAALGPAIAKGLELDAYVLERAWGGGSLRVTASDSASPRYHRDAAAETTFGLRAKQKIAFFDYRVEAGLQIGSRPGSAPTVTGGVLSRNDAPKIDIFAQQVDAELGVSLVPDRLRVALEGVYASGNDPSNDARRKNEGWDDLFPTGHRYLGLSDVFNVNNVKRTNVASGVFHLVYTPLSTLTLQADGHLFARPEKLRVDAPDGHLAGGEIDAWAVLVLAKGLKLRGLYAIFLPRESFYPAQQPSAAADPVHYAELELRFDM